MKKTLNNIREFFWPLLHINNAPKQHIKHNSDEIRVNVENLDKVLDYTVKLYESEMSRSSSVEGKSSLFIGTLSVVITIIIAITTLLINSSKFNIALVFIVINLFFLTIYMVRTIWFSIKVLERKSFHAFYYNDFMIVNVKEEFSKRLIAELLNKIDINSDIINSKVNNMTMAQEYFKRAVVTLAIYSCTLLLFFLNKSVYDLVQLKTRIVNLINSIYIDSVLVIIWVVILITSVGVNFILYNKLKKKHNRNANNLNKENNYLQRI